MIDSITKNRISREDIEAALIPVLGEKPSTINELHEGMFNAAYSVELENGKKYVLKVAPSPKVTLLHYEKDLIHTEVMTLKLLEKKTSIPVPHVLYLSQRGEELGNSPWFLMDFLEGIPYNRLRKDLPDETQRNISIQLGVSLKEMNSIRGPLFGYPGIPEEQSQIWEDSFPHMLEGILEDGLKMNIPLPMGYDEIRRLAEKDYYALSEVTLPSLIHWDLWDGNIFIKEGKVTGIIDCERALWADPLMEQNFCSISSLGSAFFEGYGRGIPSTEGEKARRRLYDLYLFLIMVIETYYRKFQPNEQIKWSYPLLEKFLAAYPR
jgi:aminoglycoside phosphotransferase (APT) family kinase protein